LARLREGMRLAAARRPSAWRRWITAGPDVVER
jgi:hypothetical protein